MARVLMVSSEASPWAKSGGLADVLGALPPALAQAGHSVGVVIPRYMGAVEAPARRVLAGLSIPLGKAHFSADIWELIIDKVTVYFVQNDALLYRPHLYGDAQGDYPDNHIRFAFLAKAALEIARRLFATDIFHCHDWQASLLPLYLREAAVVDPTFLGAKTLLTIHNLGYQGLFPAPALSDISVPARLFQPGGIEFYGQVNFLKAGIVYSDRLNTVSRKYAEEIQTLEYGFGLDGLLRDRAAELSGILNGVDYHRWNPETDASLPAPYSASNLAGKQVCKSALLEEVGLPPEAIDRPLLGIVSRFAGQKGFDLIEDIAWKLFEEDLYLVALGSGEARYEELFQRLQRDFPDRVGLRIGYDDPLAHRIEAGSDIFLMPSQYEPCGLNQIYSLRYGTVPVVRATGGLDDTIDVSTGFKFSAYNGEALLLATRKAVSAWEDRKKWTAMMVRGMHENFSWAASAAEYSKLYSELHPLAAVEI